jgi:hypothetical protein
MRYPFMGRWAQEPVKMPFPWKSFPQASSSPEKWMARPEDKQTNEEPPSHRCSWKVRPTAPLWLINHNAG